MFQVGKWLIDLKRSVHSQLRCKSARYELAIRSKNAIRSVLVWGKVLIFVKFSPLLSNVALESWEQDVSNKFVRFNEAVYAYENEERAGGSIIG